MKKISVILALSLMSAAGIAYASADQHPPKHVDWSFDGVMGKVDKPSAQRGFQVYKEVCSACHGLSRVAFRTLTDIGFSAAEVKALAKEYTVKDGPNDDGDMFDRPGLPSDKFVPPYANENAARASNNGAYPPDLSLIVKARPNGANYVYSLLTGYGAAPTYRCAATDEAGECVKFEAIAGGHGAEAGDHKETSVGVQVAGESKEAAESEAMDKNPPAEVKQEASTEGVYSCIAIHHEEVVAKNGKKSTRETCVKMQGGLHYNPYFPGMQIAMAQPISDGQVTFEDNTEASQSQMAHDVVNFLQWAAEPEMEHRKHMGIKVLLYLAVFTGFMYVAKKHIWKKLH